MNRSASQMLRLYRQPRRSAHVQIAFIGARLERRIKQNLTPEQWERIERMWCDTDSLALRATCSRFPDIFRLERAAAPTPGLRLRHVTRRKAA
jgi:hypothetical protein